MTTKKAPPTDNPTAHGCACECGLPITSKAMYKPGHDARHVSTLLGYLHNDIADGKPITKREIASIAKALPSDPLRAKFTRAAERIAATATTKGGEK
ncbi:hypothetical protein AAIB33_10575 [Microbacterium sp. AZCO]|uniref:hypothetical protein n=1 Tax=Microbacterium sp. AZCO TaxID=3142976 RepID=UPI0031F33AC5